MFSSSRLCPWGILVGEVSALRPLLGVPHGSLALPLCRAVWKLAKDSRNLARTLYFLYLNFLICKVEAEG